MKSALLVFAHPDDESMFFVPLLLQLVEQSVAIYWLCLTTGNFGRQGAIRGKELVAAGSVFRIPASHISVIDDPGFQDGPASDWDMDAASSVVLQHIEKWKPDEVYTFDAFGVSGHPNHRATYHCVRNLFSSDSTTSPAVSSAKLWFLESVNLARKYSGLLDIPFSYAEAAGLCPPITKPSENRKLVIWKPSWAASHRAMSAHHSQFVWFRRLFVVFSRYTTLNTFVPFDSFDHLHNDKAE
eukprot:ANDGO_06987.mRNA.1 putative N-acetylglucosaminyl-phosphatidylinositol de-N-acetylase